MIKKPMIYLFASVVILVVAFLLMYRPLFTNPGQTTAKKMDETSVEPLTSATIFDTAATNTKGYSPGAEMKSLAELVVEYGDLQLIDAHNHDASGFTYARMMKTWEQNSVDRVVLFGDVSEPSAIGTDEISWNAYQEAPDQFIPFFSGINLLDESGLQTVKDNLEKGYFGIGEIAAASTNSPVLANVAWKTKDPMDGILPEIYKLCAEYKTPVLLHIDPPSGEPVRQLEEALEANPDTTFIFAHINAYNFPDHVEYLLKKHPNLYADFFAGFTASNPESFNHLDDFVSVMKQFPDRFLLSTDSGYGLPGGEEKAKGMNRLIDALGDRQVAKQVATGNLERLIRVQPATQTQLEALRKANDLPHGMKKDLSSLTKEEAGKLFSSKETDQ